MMPRTFRHDHKSSKILLKMFIVALVFIQTLIVGVGKSYYDRFVVMEDRDTKLTEDVERLTFELKSTNDKLSTIEESLRSINLYLLDETDVKRTSKPPAL